MPSISNNWKWKWKLLSCPTLCDPMDCTVHGILQARILEWVAFPFSRGIFPTQGLNPGLPPCWRILNQLRHRETHEYCRGSHSLLQWVFPTQESNLGLLHRQAHSLPAELPGNPIISNNYSLQINKGFALRFFFVIQNNFYKVDTLKMLVIVLILSLDCLQD